MLGAIFREKGVDLGRVLQCEVAFSMFTS